MGELSAIVMQFPYQGLFCLLILGSIGFPFPEDAILLSCGFLISRRIVMPIPAFLVVYTGIIIGDFIIYSFGRKYGRAVVTHKRFRKLIHPEKLCSLERRFAKFGALSILLGRQIIGVRAQTMIAAGVLRMPLRTFLLTDAFASFLTVSIMVSLGYTGMKGLTNHSLTVQLEYLLIIVLLATAFYFVRWLRSKRRRKIEVKNNEMAIEKFSC